MSNLEPIEDKDLDLQKKFKEGEKEPNRVAENNTEKSLPTENVPERKEGVVGKEEAYSKILSKVKSHQAPADDLIPDDAKNVSAEESAEAKIDKLVKLATQKGVVHAVKVARHLDDNYALDEFHDRLMAEDLHDALMKNGLIREI